MNNSENSMWGRSQMNNSLDGAREKHQAARKLEKTTKLHQNATSEVERNKQYNAAKNAALIQGITAMSKLEEKVREEHTKVTALKQSQGRALEALDQLEQVELAYMLGRSCSQMNYSLDGAREKHQAARKLEKTTKLHQNATSEVERNNNAALIQGIRAMSKLKEKVREEHTKVTALKQSQERALEALDQLEQVELAYMLGRASDDLLNLL